MFSKKTPAEAYFAAVKLLTKCEAAHRQNLDRLDQALIDREASKVPGLRRDCGKSERELQTALQAAADAHRSYWHGRADALLPELRQAAVVLAEYNALRRLGGDEVANPGAARLQQFAIDGINAANLLAQGVLSDLDGVPHDSPDCELLADYLGSWR